MNTISSTPIFFPVHGYHLPSFNEVHRERVEYEYYILYNILS